MAKRWHFPAAIQRAIALHHTSAEADKDNGLTDVMYVANLFSHALSDNPQIEEGSPSLVLEAKVRLGINSTTLEALTAEARQLYAGALLLIGG